MRHNPVNRQRNIASYVFAAVLLFVFAAVLFQMVIPHTANVDTNELVTSRVVTTVTGRGTVIRQETVLQASATGLLYELVEDGEKVAADSEIYCIYPSVDVGNAAGVREQLRIFDTALSDLYSAVGSSSLSTLPTLREGVYLAYSSFVDAEQAGDVAVLQTQQKQWLTLLNRMKRLTAGTTYEKQIEMVEDAKRELLSACGYCVTGTSLQGRSGYYWSASACDGYESVLYPARLETMTAAALQDVLTNEKTTIGADCVGKMVFGTVWYLALPTSPQDASVFTVGKSYAVTLTADGITLPMTLERINLSEEDALLVFACSRQPDGFDYEREQTVSVAVGEKTGYRIPSDAVVRYDGEWGVFILRGGTVYFRRIASLANGPDYVLVSVKDTEPEKATVYSYLAATDMLITCGKNLYNGKVLS